MTDTADRISRALEGRYRIVREVGAGGMATVYLADDLRHNRQVALKVLRPELAATMGPERFFREIQVAARLQHPHILPLHDSGEADGFLFFVMPFVTGESLRTRLDRIGELPVTDAVRILIEVADALSYSHSQGVVHRDIKPDNVMLSGRHALVTDFGVAKAVSEAAGESKVTTAGVALGTPAYMAPEQAVADPQIDHRVDIYALGVLGYELLAGRTPFSGLPPQQMLMAHVTEAPDPVRKYRDACPPELEAIIMRCLAKRAADRYQSADEVLHLLEPLIASSGGITPTQSRPASTASIADEPVKQQVPAYAFIGIGVAIVASLVAVLVSGGKGKEPPAFERVRLTATGGAFWASLSPDGTRVAGGQRRCVSDDECLVDLRIQDTEGAGSAAIVEGLVGLGMIDWSEDGRWLVYSASSGDRYGMWAVLALGGEPRYLGCCQASIGRGDTLIITDPATRATGAQKLYLLTLADGRTVDSIALGGWSEYAGMAWIVPGSDRLLVVRDDRVAANELLLVDRAGTTLDSIEIAGADFGQHELRTHDRGFSVGVEDPSTQTVEFRRYRVSADRIDAEPTVLASGVAAKGGSQVARNGSIVVTDGLAEYAVWALERKSLAATVFTRRLVERSTAPLTGSISPAGDRLFINRERPNDPGLVELSVVPFGGGAATSLGTERDLFDWDWAQDGAHVILVKRTGPDSIALSELDVTTGRQRSIATLSGDRSRFETVQGGGMVNVRGIKDVELRGLRARSDTVFAGPAALAAIDFLNPQPDGASVMTIGWSLTNESILIHRMSLLDGRSEEIASLVGEGVNDLNRMPDGSFLVPIRITQASDIWYRVSPGGGAPVRVGISIPGESSYRFAVSGLRAIARERVNRSDIFLLKPVNGARR